MSIVNVQSRRVGRPPCCPPETAKRIWELKSQGHSLRRIAELLNDEEVPTPMGQALWGKSHVHRLLGTVYMQQLGAGLHTSADSSTSPRV
jgi:hypothetical protein